MAAWPLWKLQEQSLIILGVTSNTAGRDFSVLQRTPCLRAVYKLMLPETLARFRGESFLNIRVPGIALKHFCGSPFAVVLPRTVTLTVVGAASVMCRKFLRLLEMQARCPQGLAELSKKEGGGQQGAATMPPNLSSNTSPNSKRQ